MRKPVRLDRGARPNVIQPRNIPQSAAPTAPPQGNALIGKGCGLAIAAVIVALMIGKCASTAPVSQTDSPAQATSEPAYVAVRSLNCRREPNASAAVAEGLTRDDQVVVAERRGEWARLTRFNGDCWVSKDFITDTPPAKHAATEPPSQSQSQGLVSAQTASSIAAAGSSYAIGKAAKSNFKRSRSTRPSWSRKRRNSSRTFYGSGCPCSGSQVCIGPRGGRYCITSGGNKRYGV